jgi:hypothetical protein
MSFTKKPAAREAVNLEALEARDTALTAEWQRLQKLEASISERIRAEESSLHSDHDLRTDYGRKIDDLAADIIAGGSGTTTMPPVTSPAEQLAAVGKALELNAKQRRELQPDLMVARFEEHFADKHLAARGKLSQAIVGAKLAYDELMAITDQAVTAGALERRSFARTVNFASAAQLPNALATMRLCDFRRDNRNLLES